MFCCPKERLRDRVGSPAARAASPNAHSRSPRSGSDPGSPATPLTSGDPAARLQYLEAVDGSHCTAVPHTQRVRTLPAPQVTPAVAAAPLSAGSPLRRRCAEQMMSSVGRTARHRQRARARSAIAARRCRARRAVAGVLAEMVSAISAWGKRYRPLSTNKRRAAVAGCSSSGVLPEVLGHRRQEHAVDARGVPASSAAAARKAAIVVAGSRSSRRTRTA